MENKIEKLRSYIGQLLDLSAGNINELVLTKDNEAVNLLIEVLREAIESNKEFVDFDAEMSRQETESKSAHCPKCGDEVLGDTDGLCSNCV